MKKILLILVLLLVAFRANTQPSLYIIVSRQFAMQHNGYTNDGVRYFNSVWLLIDNDTTWVTDINSYTEFPELWQVAPSDEEKIYLEPEQFPRDTILINQ